MRALLAWCALMVGAVLNGTFRVAVLNPRLGERLGHVMSSVMLCTLIVALTWLFIRWIGPQSSTGSLRVGMIWFGLTLAFEFGFGHFVAGKPWHELLADYTVAAGRSGSSCC